MLSCIFFAKCCGFILLSEQLLLLIVDIALPGDDVVSSCMRKSPGHVARCHHGIEALMACTARETRQRMW